ncbi:MAG: hypothetical protein KatS3mg011_0152 [Acidimicrobiia bacterium]|nr:MAG: hypothetical protein KatS3mg011_0152 [Acidimicrobiia bacterium]
MRDPIGVRKLGVAGLVLVLACCATPTPDDVDLGDLGTTPASAGSQGGGAEHPVGSTTSTSTTVQDGAVHPSITRPSEADDRPPTQSSDQTSDEAVPADLIEAIRVDAAARSGVDVASVRVISTQAMIYPDSSLGCPRPGETYLQVITPGYRVVVSAGDATLDYRADTRGRFRLCEAGTVP